MHSILCWASVMFSIIYSESQIRVLYAECRGAFFVDQNRWNLKLKKQCEIVRWYVPSEKERNKKWYHLCQMSGLESSTFFFDPSAESFSMRRHFVLKNITLESLQSYTKKFIQVSTLKKIILTQHILPATCTISMIIIVFDDSRGINCAHRSVTIL